MTMDVDGQSFLSSFVPLRRSDSVWEACASPVAACIKREVPMQRFNHQEFLGLHHPYSPLLSVEEDAHLPCVDMSW